MFRPARKQTLARIVLVWFALFVGLASAAPWAQPHRFELVCSAAGGTSIVDVGGEAERAPIAHGLDCVLCLPCCAPPPHAGTPRLLPELAESTVPPRKDPHPHGAAAAPPPGRGPPLFV